MKIHISLTCKLPIARDINDNIAMTDNLPLIPHWRRVAIDQQIQQLLDSGFIGKSNSLYSCSYCTSIE